MLRSTGSSNSQASSPKVDSTSSSAIRRISPQRRSPTIDGRDSGPAIAPTSTRHAWNGRRACSRARGRFSMILPHSVSFSGRFQVLRNLLRLRFPEAWASSYARIPAGLFTNDTRVRNTIFVGRADGARDRGSFGVMHTTRCRRWISEYRPHLFDTTRYTTPDPRLASEFWPFIDSTELATIFAHLVQECGTGIGQLTMPRNGAARLGFKTNAYNWLSVFANEPPAEDPLGQPIPQTQISWLNFPTEPLRDLALMCLAGKWSYAWWVTYGDDFHVTKAPLGELPSEPTGVGRVFPSSSLTRTSY